MNKSGIATSRKKCIARRWQLNRKLFGPESQEVAASLNDLGLALMVQHKLSEAEKVDGEALAIRQRLFGKENADTATSINDLGAVYREEGKLAEAEALAREALRSQSKDYPEEKTWRWRIRCVT